MYSSVDEESIGKKEYRSEKLEDLKPSGLLKLLK